MPISSITAARDAIYGALKTAVDASAFSSLVTYYPDVVGVMPDTTEAHLRAFLDHQDERQVTLGGIGSRRYRVTGIVTVQIFSPLGEGQVDSDQISGVVKTAFRGVNTGADAIEFRRVRVVDVGRSGGWLQTNVVAEFEYDEIA
jgi:Bacteriophage related domain of unknown function